MNVSDELQFAVMERDQLRTKVRRAAEAIAAILDAERMNLTDSEREWCIAQAEGWLADYESRNVATSSESATNSDALCVWRAGKTLPISGFSAYGEYTACKSDRHAGIEDIEVLRDWTFCPYCDTPRKIEIKVAD